MNITYTDYFEVPAAFDSTREALSDPDIWAMLPLTAERMGSMWRWGSELYHISSTSQHEQSDAQQYQPGAAPYTISWEITPVATGGYVHIEATLYDAIIATHVTVRVSLTHQDTIWPWKRLLAFGLLANHMRTCRKALVHILSNRQYTVSTAAVDDPPGTEQPADPVQPLRRTSDLAERLRPRYPQTVAHFEAMGTLDHLERVWWLERNWERMLRGDYDASVYQRQSFRTISTNGAPQQQGTLDYDLIYAGGGLGLLHAAVMAQCYGWRVMLFDRSDVGCAHREWNISRAELQALVDIGVVTWEDLAPVIMREYRTGVVDFYTSAYSKVPHNNVWFPDVLNVAIDAGALLRLMRRKLEQAGGTILDRRSFRCVQSIDGNGNGQPPHVAVVLETLADARADAREERYTARLLLDGMGSTSPLALVRHAGEPFAGLCPTVGTVASGFVPGTERHQFDPTVGDILISIADAQDGKQFIWEGFPGRNDELTVYVFYYVALKNAGQRSPNHRPAQPVPSDAPPAYSLLELFEQYFALLPSYKQPGPDFRHVKPVYGYIPGRHSLQSQEAPLLRGVLPVGDSAAQQSPLTYCGFGSHVRNLHRTTSLLDYALQHNLVEPHHLRHISAFQTNVSLNWVFSRFMQAWGQPHSVNELQNAFLGALNELGIDLASRFFRDRMHWSDYNKVVWYTMMRYKDVFIIAWPVLGVPGVWQWFCDYVRFSIAAAYASGARAIGPQGEAWMQELGRRISPAVSLRIRARYAEWRAMGWL